MLENNETTVKKKFNPKKIIIYSSIAVILIALIIIGIVIISDISFYSEVARDDVTLEFIEKWNSSDATNQLTGGTKLSDEVGEHSYQISDSVTVSYEINKYLWITYGSGFVELSLGDMDFDAIKELSVEYINLFGHIKDFSNRYDMALATGSISEEKEPVKIVVNEYQAVIYCRDESSCKFSKDGPPYKLATNYTLDSFVEEYNNIVRSSFKKEVSFTNASDSDYINSAKTLVENTLKFPDTAVYMTETVIETDDYGRAIIYLDYTAENALGMALRSACYIFINGCNTSQSTFEYNIANYRCDSPELIDLYKAANDFGLDPVEVSAEKYIINVEEIADNGKTLITKEIAYDMKQIVLNCGTLNFYLDGQTVVAIMFDADLYGNNEEVKLITDAIYSVQAGKTKLVTSSDASVFFDVEETKTSHDETTYISGGILLQRQEKDTTIAYVVMPLDVKQYNLGDEQWKPLYNDGYYEALGDSFFVKEEYDTALWFYQEGNVCSDNYKKTAFKVAESFENSKEYEKAIALYEHAIDLPEAKERYEECNYLQGGIYLSEGNFDGAVNAFYAAGNYSDASEKLDDAMFAKTVSEEGKDAMYERYSESQWSRTGNTMFLDLRFRDDGYVELKMKAYARSTSPGGGYEEGYVSVIGKYTKKNFHKIVLGDLYIGELDRSGIIVPSTTKYFNAGIVATTTRTEKYGGDITSVSFSGMKECICDTEPYGFIFDDGTEIFFLVYDDGEKPGKLPEIKEATSVSGEFYVSGDTSTKLTFTSDGIVTLTVRAMEESGWRNAAVYFVGKYELVSETEIKLGDLYFDGYDDFYSGTELVENKDLCFYKAGMSFTMQYEGVDYMGKPIWTGTLKGVDNCINSDAELKDKSGSTYYIGEFGTSFKALQNPVVK